MNEQTDKLLVDKLLVDKLLVKAGAYFGGEGVVYDRFDPKKFAELIVKECAAIASNTNLEDVDGGDSAVLFAAREQILEHFGVEE